MRTPNKPGIFKISDTAFIGFILLSLTLTIYIFLAGDALTAGDGSPLPTGVFGVHGLMVTLTLATVVVYAGLLWSRHRFLSKFEFYQGPGFALMVHPGDYETALNGNEVIRLAQTAFQEWGTVLGEEAVNRFTNGSLFWVWFLPWPIEQVRGTDLKVAGRTIVGSKMMQVSYRTPTVALDTTAFRHEIGHVVQGFVTGSWDESEHHERARQHNLR